MCAKDDLIRRKGPLLISTQMWEVLFQTHDRRLAGELATAESVTAKDPNHVDTFGLDFAFSFANILSLIAFIISYCSFADELVYAPNRATVVLIIISLVYVTIRNLSCKARCRRSTPSTLLAGFIPTTKIRNPLLKTLENAAKSRILLACADGRIRQCYLTICAILADYEEQVLLTGVKKNRYCMRCTRCLNKGHDDFVHLVDCFGWKHYNFNIHVSLATDTLHLLLKGLLNECFRQVMHSTGLKRFNNKRAFTELIAVVSPLFILKAPFALHFICAVCDLVTLAQYKRALERMNVFKEEFRVYQRTLGEEKNFNYPKALDSICTRANSEAHYITIVKQFYSMTNKKEVTRPLPFCRLGWLILGIQPHSTKLPLSEVAANIAISDFTHAAAVFRSSGKRHNDPKHCDKEVLHLILIIIDYTCYDKDGKHIAYIRAFSKVLLFNNNRQIDNTTRMLSMPFKFYDLSTIIRLVHLVLRDLPNLITCTTMSYYVNNYIDWDEYNCLYSLTFDINLLRTLREYRQKRTRNN
ncbi:hypothetical protein HBI27_125450 [Parastagonospora nodorum]|nr:hypothetical protein HBI27_125450 [Parastagonospora nodorum]